MEWDMPASGERKSFLRFAFLPTIVGNKRVWLEFYFIEKYWSDSYNEWKTTGCKYLYREG